MNLPTLTTAARTEKNLDIAKIAMFVPSVFAIIVSFLVAIFIVWPRLSDVIVSQKTNKNLSQKADNLEKKASLLASLDKSTLKSQLVTVDEIIPSDKEIFSFLGQIEQIKNNSGVAITNLSVGSVGQFSSGKTSSAASSPAATSQSNAVTDSVLASANIVQMRLSIESDYRSVMQFLNSLYALRRVVLVKDFSMSASGNQISSSMTINALWQSLPTELASVEAPIAILTKSQKDLISRVESAGSSLPTVAVPDVPKGRSDIFTPFGK